MEKGLRYTTEAVKRFGIRGILKVVSISSWFILPFLIWIQIYLYLGQGYFIDVWAIPGLIITLFYVAFSSLFSVWLIRLDKKLVKHVEHAKEIFDRPEDPKSEENFRLVCHKFIIPYLHVPSVTLFGVFGFLRSLSILRKVLIRSLQTLVHLYASYAIMVLFVINQSFFIQIWNSISPHIPYLPEISSVLLFFSQNPILSIVLVFLLSLYSHMVIFFVKRGYTTYSGVIVDILYDSFSVFQKMCFLLALLISIPWQVENRSKTLRFAPFTFPTSLPLIIQQATRNIENKESNVTKWSYTVEDEDDIEALKRIILWQKDFHPIVRSFCVRVDSKVALEVIKELTPTLFLGTIGNRCAILGRIEYDSYEKIYREYFFFDNRHVKDEFKSIAEIEIAEQKKLKQQIPTNLIDLMRRLALGKEK